MRSESGPVEAPIEAATAQAGFGVEGEQRDLPDHDMPGDGTLLARLTKAMAWCLGVTGWVVAAIFILYSHGESDRVRNTRQADGTQVARISAILNGTVAVQHFLAVTKHAQTIDMAPQQRLRGDASATFLYTAGSGRGAIVVDGLPALHPGHVYAVWVRDMDQRWWHVGSVAPSSPGAEASALLMAPVALDRYGSVSLDIEARQDVTSPTSNMLFAVRLPSVTGG